MNTDPGILVLVLVVAINGIYMIVSDVRFLKRQEVLKQELKRLEDKYK